MPARDRYVLIAILLGSFALRLAVAWRLPNIHHADEVYMVAEQASRSVTGFGIVPWEFRTASRAALLPTLVEPIYRLRVTPATQRLLQSALFCALSLIPVWVAFRWSRSLYGLRAGVVAAAIMATWFELVYFAPKATVDAVCGYLLLAGVFLVRPGARPAAVFAGAFSLGIAMAMRVQIGPAVALGLSLAFALGERWRISALLAGVGAALAAAGAVEWRWWGTPFQGQIGYLMMEFKHHASQYFAREPLIFYIKQYILMYGMALPVIAYLIYRGATKAPVLLITALTVIVPFHFVGHKEYRFIVAGLPLLVLLMGLAISDLMTPVARTSTASEPRERSGDRGDPASARVEGSGGAKPPGDGRTLTIFFAGWVVAMLAVSFGDTYRPLWTRHGNHVLAFEEIGRQPGACGVALVGIRWWQTPGYSGLGSNIPIYEITGDNQARILSAANYVLQATKAEPPPTPYERWRAYTRPVQYLYRRPGGCIPDPTSQIIRPPGIPGVE